MELRVFCCVCLRERVDGVWSKTGITREARIKLEKAGENISDSYCTPCTEEAIEQVRKLEDGELCDFFGCDIRQGCNGKDSFTECGKYKTRGQENGQTSES